MDCFAHAYWCTCLCVDEDFPKRMLGMFEVAHTNDESVHARAHVALADTPLTQKAEASVELELEV